MTKSKELDFIAIDMIARSIENIDNLGDHIHEFYPDFAEYGDMLQNIESTLKYLKGSIISWKYSPCDAGHGVKHVIMVMAISLWLGIKLKKKVDFEIDFRMLAVQAAFHDVSIADMGRENHERFSAIELLKDDFVFKRFDKEKLMIMVNSVISHRASKRTAKDNDVSSLSGWYSSVLSDADKNPTIDVYLERATYTAVCEHGFRGSEAVEHVFEHGVKKFGTNGYAGMCIFEEAYVLSDEFREIVYDEPRFRERVEKYVTAYIGALESEERRQCAETVQAG